MWKIDTEQPFVYITFDDGPHPVVTQFVLDTLLKYDAKATFFCLGENVEKYPALYARILAEGHSVGNHTYQHLDGWKTKNKNYYSDIAQAQKAIDSSLYRPPFGHITPRQVNFLASQPKPLRTIMWSINSGDWDEDTPPEKCYSNVAGLIEPGAIVVFHDNHLSGRNLEYTLPRLLATFSEQGYQFKRIES